MRSQESYFLFIVNVLAKQLIAIEVDGPVLEFLR
jgi:hypothetical protein